MIFTKRTTQEEFLERFIQLGYYLPMARLKPNLVRTKPYMDAVAQARELGLLDARSYWRMRVLALKDQETQAYQVAKDYGEV